MALSNDKVPIFIIILASMELSMAAYGTHDLFTSLAQLKQLWINERTVISDIENLIMKLETSNYKGNETNVLIDYVNSHKIHQLDQEPNFDYLGHPLDAYHFVRHVATGWERIRNEIFTNSSHIATQYKQEFDALKKREAEKLPAKRDVEGGAFGIVRLWCLYKFNATKFIQDGVISTTLGNGQIIRSRPSVMKPNSFDLVQFSNEGQQNYLYDAATTFIEAAAEKARTDEGDKEVSKLFQTHYGSVMGFKQLDKLSTSLKKVHDHYLEKRGSAGLYMRTHSVPFDVKLRKKKKYKGKNELTARISVYDRATVAYYDNQSMRGNETAKSLYDEAGAYQGDELCRGTQLRTSQEMSNLTCYYAHNGSPWLRLGPMRVEVNSYEPFHMTIRNLLFEDECDRITEFLAPLLDFPPGRMDHRRRKNDWTMKNCWPKENQNVYLDKMNRRIEHLTRLNANAYKNYSEPFMCGNYGIGGHYFIHPDYHHPHPQHYFPGATGNRVATVMTVLESPTAGGATVWPYARISVFPEKGAGIYWRNAYTDDTNDIFTRHKACPVLYGQKWIGNKWVGYNAQWNQQNCKIHPTTPFDPVLY